MITKLLHGLVLGGAVLALTVLVLARPLRIAEVEELAAPLPRRFRPRGRRHTSGPRP